MGGGTTGTAVSTTFRDNVRIALQEVSTTTVFSNNELDLAINEALIEYSKKNPREATATLDTVADSRLVDISSLASTLLWGYNERSFHTLYGLEYKTAQSPRKYRNYRIHSGGYIEMDIDNAPSAASDDVYVRYYIAHTTSTIPSADYYIVMKLACAIAAINKPLNYINTIEAETTKFDNITNNLANMNRHIETAVNLLNSGEPLIGKNKSKALDVIEDISAITRNSLKDMDEAGSFFNASNFGTPETEYLNKAISGLQVASAKLSQSQGYLSLEEIPQSYRSHASGHLNAANESFAEARGYIEYLKVRMQDTNLVDKYEAWGNRLKASLQPELAKCAIHRGQKRWPTA